MNGYSPAERHTSWALLLCALSIGGCAGIQIDPTGEAVFTSQSPTVPVYDPFARPTQVVLSPQQPVIVPVGTQVALVASVRGPDGYLRTNQRVDWSLEPGSAGQILNLNRRSFMDLVLLDPVTPAILDPCHAVGSTTRSYERLPPGPASSGPLDILPGQAWIVVGSCKEGTSQVAASSPRVVGGAKSVTTVHWVDVQWTLPPPSIDAAGTRHTLTTSVMRQSNQAPLAGYVIHYEIADGPPAGFQPSGTRAADLTTDAAGQASVEIVQPQPAPGTNRIAVQIIRPAGLAGSGPPLVVGRGMTLKTWSSPGLVVRRTGPAVGAVGQSLTFRVEVANPGDQPAENIVVTETVPDGLSLLASRPAGEPAGNTIRWNLGQLRALENRVLEIDYRADRSGSFTTCASATAAGGLTSRDCRTTNVDIIAPLPPNFPPPPAEGPGPAAGPSPSAAAPSIDLQVSGPSQAAVGEHVVFEAVVTNLGQAPAIGLTLRDSFDPGLDHRGTTLHAIDRDLPELAPNQSRSVRISFTVSGTGELCQRVEVRCGKSVVATRKQCLVANLATSPPPSSPPGGAAPAVPGPATPDLGAPPSTPPIGPPGLTLILKNPTSATVGDTIEFLMQVTNSTSGPLSDVKVTSLLDANFLATEATKDYKVEGDSYSWTIPSLPANQPKTFVLKANCVSPGLSACNRVQVASREGWRADQRTCLEVRAAAQPEAAGNLDVNITNVHEPINVGQEETYYIDLVNRGQQPDSQVTLTVQLPPQMVPVLLQTVGPLVDGRSLGKEAHGQVVTFQPVSRLDPDQKLSYRVRARTVSPGLVQVQAQVTSQSVRQPKIAQKKTTINAPSPSP